MGKQSFWLCQGDGGLGGANVEMGEGRRWVFGRFSGICVRNRLLSENFKKVIGIREKMLDTAGGVA